LREKLLDRSSGFGKAYLNCLIKEIKVTGRDVVVTGSKETLAMAIADTKKGTSIEVPKSVLGWLPDLGSN
jgi:site-specific DNA recombinase